MMAKLSQPESHGNMVVRELPDSANANLPVICCVLWHPVRVCGTDRALDKKQQQEMA